MLTCWRWWVAGFCALVVVLAGCAGAASDTSQATATPVADDAASTAEDALEGELSFAGSTTVQPLAERLAEAYQERHPNVILDIAAGGSLVGIQGVQNGDIDIGMASRELKPEEVTEGMEAHRIAVDVLAVIVHSTNPVENLRRDELSAIYRGELTNWSEIGGPDMPILPVIREVTSGTRGAFDDIVLGGADPTADADVQITASEVEARVASSENAIGYVGFGHIDLDEIKVVRIDDVEPSPENALDGSYTLQRPLQLLTGPLSRELAQTFIDFALSETGQQIVVEDGWVPARAE